MRYAIAALFALFATTAFAQEESPYIDNFSDYCKVAPKGGTVVYENASMNGRWTYNSFGNYGVCHDTLTGRTRTYKRGRLVKTFSRNEQVKITIDGTTYALLNNSLVEVRKTPAPKKISKKPAARKAAAKPTPKAMVLEIDLSDDFADGAIALDTDDL